MEAAGLATGRPGEDPPLVQGSPRLLSGSWCDLGEWWVGELASDHAYETVITPILLHLLRAEPDSSYLDLGSGDGRMMRVLRDLGADPHGIEINPELASLSRRFGPTVVGELPDLSVFEEARFQGAYCVLVLEHLRDHGALFAEAARVVEVGGIFVLVANHPVWTAPGSTPITDRDGEVLWRPGDYFSDGVTEEPAGVGTVIFHHRSMSSLLNAAGEAGWRLEEMVEAPHHEFQDQAGIPRLLGCRWSLLP